MNPTIIANFIKKEFEDKKLPFLFNGKSYRINSFFDKNNPDEGLHLYIFISNGKFIDFKSNEQGDFIWLVKNYKKVKGPREVIKEYIYKNYFRASQSELTKRIKKLKEDGFADIKEEIFPNRIEKPSDFLPMNKKTQANKRFFDYLNGRGIDDKKIKKFKFHYAISGAYMNRVILPIFYEKKFVYFIARDVTGKSSKKYLNPKSEEVNNNGTGSIVFNLDFIEEGDTVLLCEGPFNCFHDLPKNNILAAVQGKSLLINQFKKIERKKPGKYIIAYDNDDYFNDSVSKTYNFLTKKTNVSVELINWEKYKKITKDVCDFGDLYGKVDELPIHSLSYQDYVKQHFLGV